MTAKQTTEDPVARTRLKRKMLDRWENEGGRINPESANTPRSGWRPRRSTQSKNSSAEGGPATQIDK